MEAHSDRAPLDIKAMLMNTTASLADSAGNPTPVSLAGAGRIQPDEAAARDLILAAAQPEGAVSLSFGAMISYEPTSRTRDFVIRNLGAEEKNIELSVAFSYALEGVDATVLTVHRHDRRWRVGYGTVDLEIRPSELPLEQPDPHTPSEVAIFGGQPYPRHFVTETAVSSCWRQRAPGIPHG